MAPSRPNFLIMVADDLGFSDMGLFGGEISTPNLDALGLGPNGVRLTGFHTASACSPTRSMLFSGTDNHLAGLGQMAEFAAAIPGLNKNPGYEGYLSKKVAALPEILTDAGYFTCMSGKWHLGHTADKAPVTRGFQKSFVLLPGAHNHYGYEPQITRFPRGSNKRAPWYMVDDKPLDVEDLPKPFYSSDVFVDQLVSILKGRPKDDRPFFAYLPFTAPHWPLQADPAIVAKYKGRYNAGPDSLKQERLAALARLGLADPSIKAHPMEDVMGAKQWDSMTEEQRKYSARCMEIYAAMVEQMDTAIGRVIAHLKSTGEFDNTFILFMSDNGAEGAILEAVPMFKGPQNLAGLIQAFYNNKFENLGRHDSYIWYGPHWAQAGTAPSRMFKAWITQGGIRCPCIVRYPGFPGQGKVTHEFSTVMDILPTVLELAGVRHPGKQFRGREVLEPRGKSWVGHLAGKQATIHDDKTVTGWELFGQQAIRQGDWKALYIPPPMGPDRWQLFNLRKDPGETNDLAAVEPAKLQEMLRHWDAYAGEVGFVRVPEEGLKLSLSSL
ncbi:alkaline-phosphatase-like protein [Hyaloraphidium curvatum]|nr:alkaline-phosphatase-like protein [Hyaloraphidium curvatum]